MVEGRRFSTALRDSVRRRLEMLQHADIVVGIPAFNADRTVAHVIRTAVQGLQEYYPNLLSVVLVADGGSTDDTREEAESAQMSAYNVETLVTIYRGLPGKGSAVRAILEAAHFLQARACILIDADLRSITPEWIRNLAEPVLSLRYDYVAPMYRRYKYDATITNTVVYNLTRALYGYRIRQPIGGDFAMSRFAVSKFLAHDVWSTDVARFGIDIWLTTTAIVNHMRICQVRLGAKVHDVKDPGAHLGPMFRQVIGTLFTLMQEHESIWKQIRGSQDVEIFGEEPEVHVEPFAISIEPLIESFRLGLRYFGSVWKDIVDPDIATFLADLALAPAEHFHIPVETWAKIVYAFAVTFKNWPRHQGRLVDIMLPLYNARVASLVHDLTPVPDEAAEEVFEEQARVFEEVKAYLLAKWDDPHEREKWRILPEIARSGEI